MPRFMKSKNDHGNLRNITAGENMNKTEETKSIQTEDGFFPMFFNIAGKKILIVGAGNIALRRIHTLIEFQAEVTVIAPVLKEEIRELFRTGSVHMEEREYQDTDRLSEYFMVIAATNDADLNRRICNAGKEQGILVNNASDKSQCDFYFPAIVKEGNVVAGVCAGGKDHSLVRKTAAGMRIWLKEFLEQTADSESTLV